VSEVGLQRARVLALVGIQEATAVPEHVGMDQKGHPGSLAEPCHHLTKPCRRDRAAALRDEDMRPRLVLPLQPAQGPQLAVAQIVRRPRPILHPVDADRLLHEIDLVPLQIDQLARSQSMPEGDEDCGGVPVTIAAALAGSGHQPLDLGLGEVLTWTALTNCPVFRLGRLDLDHRYFPRLSMLVKGEWHTKPQKRDSGSWWIEVVLQVFAQAIARAMP
jgi:hypothetical protein